MNREDILCLDPGQNHTGAGPAGEAGFRGQTGWQIAPQTSKSLYILRATNLDSLYWSVRRDRARTQNWSECPNRT